MKELKIAFIVGEPSGDSLGADLLGALRNAFDGEVSAIGVGGERLQAAGLKSLFDPHEIALMGIGEVAGKLPKLMRLISKTADYLAGQKPDCLVIIDSPDFTHRVARKVRRKSPSIPIINYVCPSVWAWRPGRAKAMKSYVDEVLAILPFEEASLVELGGPAACYVGHPLAEDAGLRNAQQTQAAREADRFADWTRPIRLLCLPGSRSGEIRRHMASMADTLAVLKQRGRSVEASVLTLERHASLVSAQTKVWAYPVAVVSSESAKYEMFSTADVALAASGTVTLELAVAGVPLISIYKLDPLARMFRGLVKIWTASLPNLIADQVVVPEYIDEMIRSGHLARQLEALARPGPAREAQLQGFELVRERMKTDRPSGQLAAERVLDWSTKASDTR